MAKQSAEIRKDYKRKTGREPFFNGRETVAYALYHEGELMSSSTPPTREELREKAEKIIKKNIPNGIVNIHAIGKGKMKIPLKRNLINLKDKDNGRNNNL